MQRTLCPPSLLTWSQGRELVLPKEHGSWSLAFEPIVFGLIAAPSLAGGWFGLSVAAAFFARRPLRIATREHRADRRAAARQALAICAGVSIISLLVAVRSAGLGWLAWLAPSGLAGVFFLTSDLRNNGREASAEIAGAAAFAFLPAALAALSGRSAAIAIAMGLVMCARAVPTVICVRAGLRAAKTGVCHVAPAIVSAVVAVIVALLLALAHLAPWIAVAAMVVFALRATLLLVTPRPALRARTIGMIEAVLGVCFVVTVALAWTV